MSYSKIINDDLTGRNHFLNIIATASYTLIHNEGDVQNTSDVKRNFLQPSYNLFSVGKREIPIQMKRI